MTAPKTIFKYTLGIRDEQAVEMPKGAQILCAQMQMDKLCLWALVNPENGPDERMIVIYGTGHPVYDVHENYKRRYIGTVQNGLFVWHVFEIQ